ncbi:MAG: Crp/Fnr family transcriptional regulator [Bacteroidales bacterium]|jgi:CRP-like cAMP-binding protein|nr:Crp/Fnr family transcriptional regulator [Bacteroidales bacterium]
MNSPRKTTNCKDCIYRSWAFKNLSSEELKSINKIKNEKLYLKGEKICLEGDSISSFMYLQNGLVKLFKTEGNRKEHIISIAKPKDFIGLLSVFSNTKHIYSISAIEDSIVCFVDLKVIKNLIMSNGSFAFDFFEKISSVADSVIKTRIDISTRQLRGRIAYILLLFSKHIYSSNTFNLPISRKEVAELIDMSTENVIRVLSEFRKDKLIQIEGKNIEIIDIKRLEKIYELG